MNNVMMRGVIESVPVAIKVEDALSPEDGDRFVAKLTVPGQIRPITVVIKALDNTAREAMEICPEGTAVEVIGSLNQIMKDEPFHVLIKSVRLLSVRDRDAVKAELHIN